jgi:hypothetical protein
MRENQNMTFSHAFSQSRTSNYDVTPESRKDNRISSSVKRSGTPKAGERNKINLADVDQYVGRINKL